MARRRRGGRRSLQVVAVCILALGLVPLGPPPAGGNPLVDAPPTTHPGRGFDGDPTTTRRFPQPLPVAAAVEVSRTRFDDAAAPGGRRALHALVARDDTFADSLAGAALTGDGPLLLTPSAALADRTRAELRRVLEPGGRVYVLGGPVAVRDDVVAALRADGYTVRRLAGETRVETALAVADVVRAGGSRAEVLLARAWGAPGNPTAAWADSVAGGAVAAAAGVPVLLTPTDRLHPAVADWLRTDRPSSTVLLGGPLALHERVADAVPAPRRVGGVDRADTAALIARDLWGARDGADRAFVVVNGYRSEGWIHGLVAAGLAADGAAPVLLARQDVPPPTAALLSTCGDPEVDLVVVGDGAAVPGSTRLRLDALDGWACGVDGSLVWAAGLSRPAGCDDLLARLHEMALERVGPWGLDTGRDFFEDMPIPMELAPTPDEGAGESDGPASAPPRSETNVQEVGVDEPDLVKSDGRHAFVLAGGTVHVVALGDGAPEHVTTVEVPGWAEELLLDADRLLVLGHEHRYDEGPPVEAVDEEGPRPFTTRTGGAASLLLLLDVSDPSAPTEVARLTVDGSYRSARMIDGTVRVVVNSSPPSLPFTYPPDDSEEARREATARNQEVVVSSTVGDWLPGYERHTGDGSDAGLLTSCEAVHEPEPFAGFGTLNVVTVDLSGELHPTSSSAVLASGQTVYASRANLYVTTQLWGGWEPAFAADGVTTSVHMFGITDPLATTYRGSASVDGHVLNQFSLSEHDGHLRVATTSGSTWARDGAVPASQSSVVVLHAGDGTLAEVGRVDGLGPGERIYAVRYLGDLAAVVTFREVDPLYLVDLSDPTDPAVTGELKIPGYSSYLHPVGEDRLLGVGQDVDEDDNRMRGVQLSLFDISDLERPTRLAHRRYDDGYSEAEHDHRAFLYWRQTGLVVVPLEQWGGGRSSFTGAVGVRVGASALDEIARVQHPSQTGPAAVRRSLVVGDVLYTVSHAGVQASDLDTLAERGWAGFPRAGR